MHDTLQKIGFIGAGKVGWSLGRYISERGGPDYTVCGYYSRDIGTARGAAAFAGGRAFDTAAGLAAECDLLLLTVPDGQIAAVWSELSAALPHDRETPLCVGHCSGCLSAEIFVEKPAGCSFGSMHPLLSVHDRETSYKNFAGAYFTIEGDEAFIDFAKELLTALDNSCCTIEAEHKTLYHAASVMVSNLVCALAFTGTETYKKCGLDGEFAGMAWRSLFLGNAKNIAEAGPVRALTGPVERGDTATIANHLEKLSGDERDIYLLLSRKLIETAREKNPDRDYSELALLLGAAEGIGEN